MSIKDEMTSRLEIVDGVDVFIKNIKTLKDEWCDDNKFMVYRGEPNEYSTPCMPTIYRGDALSQYTNYEQNMFMAMRQNNISNSLDYLHNAIDAQHDGFPSRLLDVTYNSLIALYFAVTPYYYKPENSMDNKDGIVYVFKYDEAYSPEAENTKEIYTEAIKSNSRLSSSHLLAYHHILIDHCKQNKRIIAQQGAFILFTGESPISIPYYQMFGIRISKYAKEKIRNELRYLFGIYTGSVYPEVELMHEEINRSKMFNTFALDYGRLTNAVLKDIKEEYDYYRDCCEFCVSTEQSIEELVSLIEKTIVYHKNSMKSFLIEMNKNSNYSNKANNVIILKEWIKHYNDILEDFIDKLPESISVIIDNEIKSKLEYI